MRAAGVAAGLVRSSGKTAGWRFAADRAAWIRNETAKGTTGPLLPEATSKSIAVTRAASAPGEQPRIAGAGGFMA